MSTINFVEQCQSKDLKKKTNLNNIFNAISINIINTISSSIKEYYKACTKNLENKNDLINDMEDNIEKFNQNLEDKKDINELKELILNIKEISYQLKLNIKSDENNILDFFDDAKILFQRLKNSINKDKNNLDKMCKKTKSPINKSNENLSINSPKKIDYKPIINNNFRFDISALKTNNISNNINTISNISPIKNNLNSSSIQKSLMTQNNSNTIQHSSKPSNIKSTDELIKYKNLNKEYQFIIQKLKQEIKIYKEQLIKYKNNSSFPIDNSRKNKNSFDINSFKKNILNDSNKNLENFGSELNKKPCTISVSPQPTHFRNTNDNLNLNLLSKTLKQYKIEIEIKNKKIFELTKILEKKNLEILELQKEIIEKNNIIETFEKNTIEKEKKENESNNEKLNKINEYLQLIEKKQNEIEGLNQLIYKIQSERENQGIEIEQLKNENEKLKDLDKDALNLIQNHQFNKLNKKLEEAEKEILSLKQKNESLINQIEEKEINSDDYYDHLSEDLNLTNCEEEFSMKKVIKDVKNKERSQDIIIDYPGTEKIRQKLKELEYDYNSIKNLVKSLLLKIKCNSSNKIYITELSKIVGFDDDVMNRIVANKSVKVKK